MTTGSVRVLIPINWLSWHPEEPDWSIPGETEDSRMYSYDIILEPNGRPWLPVLGAAVESVEDAGITRDWRLLAKKDVDLLLQYRNALRAGGRIRS